MSAFGNARVVATPLWTCQTGLSGHGGSLPPWLDSLLNCNVVPTVQRIGRRVSSDIGMGGPKSRCGLSMPGLIARAYNGKDGLLPVLAYALPRPL
jgi:hypothetical protein